jgi:hypothetical protein
MREHRLPALGSKITIYSENESRYNYFFLIQLLLCDESRQLISIFIERMGGEKWQTWVILFNLRYLHI